MYVCQLSRQEGEIPLKSVRLNPSQTRFRPWGFRFHYWRNLLSHHRSLTWGIFSKANLIGSSLGHLCWDVQYIHYGLYCEKAVAERGGEKIPGRAQGASISCRSLNFPSAHVPRPSSLVPIPPNGPTTAVSPKEKWALRKRCPKGKNIGNP